MEIEANSTAPSPQNNPQPEEFSNIDMKASLERAVENLEELCLEISVKPKPGISLHPKEDLFYFNFNLKKEALSYEARTEQRNPLTKFEEINKLLDRLQLLQQIYNEVLDNISIAIDHLKQMYDPTRYDIVITKTTSKEIAKQVNSVMQQDNASEESNKARPSSLTEQQNVGSTPAKTEVPKTDQVGSHTKDNPVSATKETLSANPQPAASSTPINTKVDQKPVKPIKRKLSFMEQEIVKKLSTTEYPIFDEQSGLLVIGPNGTTIEPKHYEGLQMKGASGATRCLCDVIFGEEVLASHSLTGNQSPAFRGRERPSKLPLDPQKTSDITHLICSKFNVNYQLVRTTITTKCADAAKKLRRLSRKAE